MIIFIFKFYSWYFQIHRSILFHTFVPMNRSKLIAGLLAIYFIALMLLPCTDCCNSHSNERARKIHTSQSDQAQDKEGCNPFCICGCYTNMILHFRVQDILTHFEMIKFNPPSIPFFNFDFNSIWQPPKFC